MAALADRTMSPIEMPKLPTESVKGFIPYLTKNSKTPIGELLEPYKAFESELRKVYAQQPTHEAVKDGTVNLVPIFDGHESELKIRARNLATETEDESAKYTMSLNHKERKTDGSPAIVSSFKDFQQNFNLFSESSLTELDWSNVVAAGSAVTTALLPVPEQWAGSKRRLREYYHEHLAPASDVDLFLYGLNEEEGLEKIKQIERNIKDSILHECTTIRTKNAITIASQYPTRHVQIVLRLYDSISQIITGFDVDCACAAYNGEQVFAAPRAVAAFVTQCNTIDLTRRSPSYENRLSKYSHRGFEVYWPLLDRTRIDPTIFERSFGRTQGLARLLILEKLPKTHDRDAYMDQRRAERGRPALHRGYRRSQLGGNIKDQEEDEVAEWVDQEEVASYHTMTVPYGPKYHAAKINRLLYAKDLLLNAEWNTQKDREVYLHRHPCFFGTAEEVLQDCCGYCPVPKTDEEIEIADEEKKTNVSGELKFLVDDPGRQEIGSFNPITDDEWTTMAYVGDTARLCQAIVDGDVEHVQDWCAQEGVDVNRRDYTGRTPLHLAVMASNVEVVKCLVDNGARLIARLVDGRTALHIAAARGDAEMVKLLMDKSLANEEEEEEKEEARRATRKAERGTQEVEEEKEDEDEKDDLESDAESVELGSEDTDDSMTMGSFVKVDKDKKDKADEGIVEDSDEDPDVYDINVIAWDYGLSPLHLAILNGHVHIIELLVSEYGADVLGPVKLVQPGTTNARGAIMTLVLAMSLPLEKGKEVVKLLLKLGATCAQADMNHFTAFHHIVADNNSDILDILLAHDRPAAFSILNNLGHTGSWNNETDSPLTTAVKKGYEAMAAKLLKLGAKVEIGFDDWIKVYLTKNPYAKNWTPEHTLQQYHSLVMQPIILAASKELGKTVEELLEHGADPNTLEKTAWSIVEDKDRARYQVGETLLNIVQNQLKSLRKYKPESEYTPPKKPLTLKGADDYTQGLVQGTYEYWTAARDFQKAKRANENEWKNYEKALEEYKEDGVEEKKAAIEEVMLELEKLEKSLIKAGAKTFKQLHPDLPKYARGQHYNYNYEPPKPVPYETKLGFQIPDLNPVKKIGYLRLFEAAWNNDINTVKSLTLAPWESEAGKPLNTPLKIAVQDSNGFSPFSIAVLKGHRELAQKTIEICIAQYHEDDGSHRRRWNTNPIDSDDEGDSGDEDELPIYSELISDKYTVDNLGEVSNIVKSDVMPLTMIEWQCYTRRFGEPSKENDRLYSILEHAVVMNDMDLFAFMMQLGAEQQAALAEDEDDQKCYTVPRTIFFKAIKLGRTAMLAEMIRLTGVGIPLNELIKTSGIEIKTKPRYYQGLSVGGKKRADWAQAPGGNVQVVEERIPPLLQAAHEGSVDSVEWFMSDAPMRRYKEFAEQNKHDKRIKTLQDTGKGFDKTIGKWLDAKSELTLHCAILYNPYRESDAPKYMTLIKHILDVSPESLEQKSSEGFTPLQIAVFAQREEVIEYLIASGANQRHRDRIGRNMLHSMVVARSGSLKTDPEKLQSMLDLFDKKNIQEMSIERVATSAGAQTPLALWMKKNGGHHPDPEFLEVLFKYSSGEELEMIDGEGDLPLHLAIKQNLSSITAYLLTLNPSLLHRENATGRTPLEMARDIYLSSRVADPPNMSTNFYHSNHEEKHSLLGRHASEFAPIVAVEGERDLGEQSKKRTYEICVQVDGELGEGGRKRRLVSLFEANEVAKRLARNQRGGRVVVNGYLVEDGRADVVSEWMGRL